MNYSEHSGAPTRGWLYSERTAPYVSTLVMLLGPLSAAPARGSGADHKLTWQLFTPLDTFCSGATTSVLLGSSPSFKWNALLKHSLKK